MFFRKKQQTEEEAADGAEQRKHYRRAPGKKHALGVKLLRHIQEPVAGEVIDVSAGGAGVSFPARRGPDMEPGERVRLSFSSLSHGGEVIAEAVTRSRFTGDDGGERYGFEFHKPGQLFEQLDAYYLKFFNRRRAMRVRPALDRKLVATFEFGGDPLQLGIHDISPDGFGVVTTPEKAAPLQEVTELEATFTLPGTREAMTWNIQAAHLSSLAQGVQFGAVFLIPEHDAKAAARRQILAEYCGARADDMARWDVT